MKNLILVFLICFPLFSQSSIRSSSVSAYTGSITYTFPGGTTAGDLAIVLVSNENSVFCNSNFPSGWTSQIANAVTFLAACVCSKVLTSSDISTGSVTVTVPGGFPGTFAIVIFIGGTGGVREVDGTANGSGATSRTVTTSSAVTSSDTAIYFGSGRASVAVTCNKGTLVAQVNNGVAGVLYTGTATAGASTATFSYSSAGSGTAQYIAIIKTGTGSIRHRVAIN